MQLLLLIAGLELQELHQGNDLLCYKREKSKTSEACLLQKQHLQDPFEIHKTEHRQVFDVVALACC